MIYRTIGFFLLGSFCYIWCNTKKELDERRKDRARAGRDAGVLGVNEQLRLREVLHVVFEEVRMVPAESEERQREQANEELLQAFIAAKKIEVVSESTLHY